MKHLITTTLLFAACAVKAPQGLPEDKPVAYCMQGEVATIVDGIAADASTPELPQELIINTGTYQVNGYEFEFPQEGLCRITFPLKENFQRLIFNNNVEALLSGIAWMVTHGTGDAALGVPQRITKALSSKLSLTCGDITVLAQEILKQKGIQSRLTLTLTLEEWNNYDNGHTMLEVYLNNSWVLFDLDNNARFYSNNQPLNLLGFVDAVKNDNYQIQNIAMDTKIDPSNFKSNAGYDFSFYAELVATQIGSWYKRVVQVPMIGDADTGALYFFDANNAAQIQSYSPAMQYVDEQAFMSRFY